MSQLPFDAWDYEEQTKMKHKVFEDYIDKWIKIVGKYNKLNYIDGFGGIGAYKDTDGSICYGSPVLAAKVAQNATNKLKRKVNIIIIDDERENLVNIEKIFKHLDITIKPILANGDFDKTINNVLDSTEKLVPTFVFIDPFGFSFRMETIARIMEIEKSEILLNFMFTRVNQFLSAPRVEKNLNELFGDTEWQKLRSLSGPWREQAIVEHYRQQLKRFARFVYYYRFEFPSAKKTYYYLYHLTNYFKGCVIMKSSFAKFNFGRVEYRGNRNSQLELFDLENVGIEQACEYLCSVYNGQQKSFQEIIEDLIDETEFLESHLRDALKKLEKTNKVEIIRIPEMTPKGKSRIGIDYNTVIRF